MSFSLQSAFDENRLTFVGELRAGIDITGLILGTALAALPFIVAGYAMISAHPPSWIESALAGSLVLGFLPGVCFVTFGGIDFSKPIKAEDIKTYVLDNPKTPLITASCVGNIWKVISSRIFPPQAQQYSIHQVL